MSVQQAARTRALNRPGRTPTRRGAVSAPSTLNTARRRPAPNPLRQLAYRLAFLLARAIAIR